MAPENTLPAFERGVMSGADMVELDYHHTQDGVLVVLHDSTLDRTTDATNRWGGSKLKVADKTLAELKQLDAGKWFKHPQPGIALPTLSEALDVIQRGSVTLLNTKANVFSPFVRRVGERVFQHLIIRQRRLELQQILSANHPVQMRAVLDPTGKLKSVQIEGQSGSANMDDTLSDALNTAAFDNNPPKAAANANGDFEFVFQAQLRAYQPSPGGGSGRIESRLSVGLL